MESKFGKYGGTALVISTVLMVITMVLHPAGGSFAHLVNTSTFIMATHSLALFSMPVTLFGFWGLAKHFKEEWLLSRLAFTFMFAGLFSGFCAAAVNGLALPMFVRAYKDASPEFIKTLSPIIRYNISLNHAFDFIFIGATSVAIVLWSAAIVRKNELPKWIGYYGLLLGCAVIVVLLSGVTLVDLRGFRLFILGIVTWIMLAGLLLRTCS